MSKRKRVRTLQRFGRIQHRMRGTTTFNDGHQHMFNNFTRRLIPGTGTHRHTFRGVTSTNDGHRHSYSGVTGPAINGQGARHFHRFRAVTRIADGHTHIISGRTSVPVMVRGRFIHKLIVENAQRIK